MFQLAESVYRRPRVSAKRNSSIEKLKTTIIFLSTGVSLPDAWRTAGFRGEGVFSNCLQNRLNLTPQQLQDEFEKNPVAEYELLDLLEFGY